MTTPEGQKTTPSGADVLAKPRMKPEDNKFHVGNGSDGKHYWLTPPQLLADLSAKHGPFDFDPCPFPKPEGFDGLTCEWGSSSYCNPPFGSIMHEGKKKGPTAWARKAIAEAAKGKRVTLVYPIDKWVLMLLAAGAKVTNLGDVRWLATEDGTAGKGTGRHIACFELGNTAPEPSAVAALIARNAELEAERDASDKYTWADGFPPKHHAEEWFLADTKFGPMALRNLPEEYAHDYTSADHTYVMQDTVKRWMQLPDSEFIAYASKGEIFELRAERDALSAENKALQSRLSGLADHCRRVYDVVPQLPIDERSMEGATDALHAFCIMLGVNGIDIDAALARTPAKGNDSCDSAT